MSPPFTYTEYTRLWENSSWLGSLGDILSQSTRQSIGETKGAIEVRLAQIEG